MVVMSRGGRLVPAWARPVVRRPLVWYRFRGLRPADAILVSYPKSGSTWLRFLLAQILTSREADFDFIRDTMPRVGRHREVPAVLPSGGRMLRTHEPLRPWFGQPGQPVIYLVRDARDVCVSYYNHVRNLGYAGDLAGFVDDFLEARVDGYGPWHQHVPTAIEFGKSGRTPFLYLVYEELRADPAHHLGRILEFLGVDADRPQVEEAVAANERERMRSKESSSEFLRSRTDGKVSLPPETRSWYEAVEPDLRARFEEVCGDALEVAGYRRAEVAQPAGADE